MLDRKETYRLYLNYIEGRKLSEAENNKLIDGLTDIIIKCYDNSCEPDKIFLFTEQFKKRIY
ncbi:hypothetical protein A3K82_01525 [Candidatus Pacearchaeota archaeon RBG_19FT_COMBO_34_9]|nr:MAG: hypothetical protein A3K82_01525 [Candidatus Pacearchaeota archaeon RBG_19FT_COMBO_34_9]OGJ16867.1 MAG: hypothetical protein A3K74_00990 [Candidatus Pacearchaeota archaeon RBG_13_33_26]